MEDGMTENLIPPLSPRQRGRAEEVEEEKEQRDEVKGADCEGKKEKGGGIINNLITNFVSPLSPKQKEEDGENAEFGAGEEREEDSPKAEEEMAGGGGRIINNFISNIFHRNEVEGGERQHQNKEKKEEIVQGNVPAVKTEKEAGGGVLNNLVSNLPISLPDDAVPATDEASILIHSIIHD